MNRQKKINNKLLEKRAKAVVFAVYCATEQFLKSITGKTKGLEGIKELERINEKEKDLITSLTSVCFLIQAQKFFCENIIEDEKVALKFEQAIYDCFEETVGVNPKPYIKDIREYIKKQGPRGELMYLGSKICKELRGPDAILMYEINLKFFGILKFGFFESLKKAWEIADKLIKE